MRVDAVRQRGAPLRQPGRRTSGRLARGKGFAQTITATGKPRRASVRSTMRLAVMRLTQSWELLLAVALGMLVAVVLLCTVPLYNTLVADVQLQQAIHAGTPAQRNVQAEVQNASISQAARDSVSAKEAALAHTYLGGFVAPMPTYYLVSDDMLLFQVGKQEFAPTDPRARQVRFHAFDYAAAAPHMHFLEGGPPQANATGLPQVLVTAEMAPLFDLHVGSTLTTTEFGDHTRTVAAQVVGVWEPLDANDPYWNGLTFTGGASANAASGNDQPQFPLLTTYDTFIQQLSRFPDLSMRQRWIYYTQPAAIDVGSMGTVANNLNAFRTHLNGDLIGVQGATSVAVATLLDHTIADIQQQEVVQALPLYVIVAQVVGLALLFVTSMAGLLIEGQNQDIATLKSRGASGGQLLGSFTLQAALLALLAALAGPFIAALLALTLVRLFIPPETLRSAGVGAAYVTAIAQPGAVVGPALVGALLGIGAVAFTALQSARMDVLAFRREQGRSARIPFWRRYYLDLGLVVLCFVGYVELNQFGALGTRVQLDGGSASPLLLVTPALLLLAGALLVLRILPWVASTGARLAARGRGLTALLAFAQVERHPGRYNRMTLLLVLAVGLGFFALSFDASLAQNTRDRAAYVVGADVRIREVAPQAATADAALRQRLAAIAGVQAVAPVYRSQASTTNDQGQHHIDTLAIDPAIFGQVSAPTSWRNDYARTPLATLLAQMRAHEHGATAETSTTAAPIWAMVSTNFAAQYDLKVGDRFNLNLAEGAFTPVPFTVGAIVQSFPTLYPEHAASGFLVADLADYLAAIRANTPDVSVDTGPNEYWLRAANGAVNGTDTTALLRALTAAQPSAQVRSIQTVRDTALLGASNPVTAGMRGLLLVGALTAALLAVLGSVVQSLVASRQRTRQFAVLRTFGMSRSQLTRLLLSEQSVVYVFGLFGGTVLGLLLISATLPFLQFADATIDASQVGVPPYIVAFNGASVAVFYVALLLAFVLALAIAARYAATIGLGKTLRLGED